MPPEIEQAAQTLPAENPAANTMYFNGVIWTGEAGLKDANTMVVRDGQLTFVGDGALVRIKADKAVDLEGRFVMPGFIDNHVHFLEGGVALASVDLRDAKTPAEFSKRIIDAAATLPKGRWILTGNWDHENWGGELPHRDWIDAGTGNTPVFVTRLDGHMALANSAALKLAGIDTNTKTPEGGEIIRDETGALSGVLKDNAMNLVFAVVPAPSDAEIIETIERAQKHAFSLGLTQVHAVTANPNETGMFDAFQKARDAGVLKIRTHVYLPLEDWKNQLIRMPKSAEADEVLKFAGLKGLVDGSLGSATAWFHEPYTDEPDNTGFPLIEPEDLTTMIEGADNAGLELAIHAIGDKAIDVLIDGMRAQAGDDINARRYRIEHFQHPTLDAINRASEYGIVASMQPYHAIDDGRWAEKKIGPERIKTTYAFKTILDAGGILTFGSDWPVAPLSPMEGVYAAVTRRTTDGAHPNGWQPQEKIGVEQALTAYTVTNAYAVFEEEVAGTLSAGKRADFIILSADPRTVDPVTLRDIGVLETVIGGESVYKTE
jgi:predicted amidohydrolase YtcJ